MPSRLIGVLAALISIGGGLYLLTSGSTSEELTIFDALFRGVGTYIIARGLWMVASLLPSDRRATT
jgi:hypothetical protein